MEGIWLNPKGTVAVRTQACAARLCGTIVWVSAVALADAKAMSNRPTRIFGEFKTITFLIR